MRFEILLVVTKNYDLLECDAMFAISISIYLRSVNPDTGGHHRI
jgi:hypothetical protein